MSVSRAHKCLFLCPLFSPHMPPVQTVQRSPQLVLEGGPLVPLPHRDGFLETSTPFSQSPSETGPTPARALLSVCNPRARGGVCFTS